MNLYRSIDPAVKLCVCDGTHTHHPDTWSTVGCVELVGAAAVAQVAEHGRGSTLHTLDTAGSGQSLSSLVKLVQLKVSSSMTELLCLTTTPHSGSGVSLQVRSSQWFCGFLVPVFQIRSRPPWAEGINSSEKLLKCYNQAV